MTEPEGWTPLRSPRRSPESGPSSPQPKRSRGSRPNGLGNGLVTTPFTQLARVHVLSTMGDGAIAVALAGSIFFSIDPADARWRVALYLILTIAPFAVVTPLLGPAIDRSRGGRRGMIIGSLALRALVAYFMSRHIDSLLLFPEAFAMLVLQKGYGVSRTALVPAVCPREDELIEANSKLSLLSALGGLVGGATGVALIAIFGNAASPVLAVLIFIVGVTMALQLPQVQIAKDPVDATEKLEVRGANIILAATAIAVLRSIVGFTTFLLAFHLRAGDDGADITEPGALLGATVAASNESDGFDPSQIADLIGTPGPPQWHLAAAGLAAGSGAILGARYAPIVRDRTTEERIVLGALIATATAAFLGAWGGGIAGTVLLAFGVGISAAMGKLGFDALVQRDAPRSNHGRAFAKFEGRFQLTWAIGAFVAVVGRFPIQFGALIVALAAGFAAVSYELGRRTDRVRRSSRVREAIRDRVPASAVERLGSNTLLNKVRPLLARFSSKSASGPGSNAGALSPPGPSAGDQPTTSSSRTPTKEQLDQTIVAAMPSPRDPVVQTGDGADVDASVATPIDQVDWATSTGPQVSGDGVWVAPEDPPTAGPGDDGQYRLWE